MPRRKTEDTDAETSEYFDEYNYEDGSMDDEYDQDELIYDEYDDQIELDDMSIIDIINEHGVEGLADAIIDCLSSSDLEKIRDRINDFLE